MGSLEGSPETLEFTPTWVVAAVCTVIILISLGVERIIHYLGKFLKSKRQDALYQALEKLKEELMVLGFISLLLTVSQTFISHICIQKSITSHMLPCKKEGSSSEAVLIPLKGSFSGHIWSRRHLLSEASSSEVCRNQGMVPLLSIEALHQLHIFIFVLALVHVLFCATTMVLGGAKIRQWKHWEVSIQKEAIQQEKISTRGHPHREFVEDRAKGVWRKTAVLSWSIAFFKQFHASVTKSDYRALRYGFIMKHCRGNPNFDFHKYLMRALEDDFKKVVGISWYLWLFVIVFLLLNVNGWHAYFWLSFLPLVLLLIVGAKLEHIITRLAHEVAENLKINPGSFHVKPSDQHIIKRLAPEVAENQITDPGSFQVMPSDHNIITRSAPEVAENQITNPGSFHVKPSDHHFWLHQPGIILYLIHFILFQNSFEIAFFFWIWSTYGFDSCILESVGYIIPRLVVGLIVQVLCSYSTLPLYAIVTQMGDTFKQAIFAEHMQNMLHGWVAGVRKRKKSGQGFGSVFKVFGPKDEKSGVASNLVQMQRLPFEGSEGFHGTRQTVTLEEIISSAIKDSQTGVKEGPK